eukprot:TRINITY_DN28433_c0_g1_i1.p1 TRINITY_DN28433_c0_g1~~TRINITY_DN28433_c0_g1_i1.p1  ORF type:complete len:878 (+),score=179.92 TRINITY_DN28433_c0_g1_i1:44-2677(+)
MMALGRLAQYLRPGHSQRNKQSSTSSSQGRTWQLPWPRKREVRNLHQAGEAEGNGSTPMPNLLCITRNRDAQQKERPKQKDTMQCQSPDRALRKQHQVQWSPCSSAKALEEDDIERPQRTSRTLHTWLHTMLDEQEDADIVTAPSGSPASLVRSARSVRSQRTLGQRSHPASPTSCRSRVLSRGRTPCSSRAMSWEGDSCDIEDFEEGSPSVLAALREHFASSVDADHSGRLSRKELFDHIRELLETSSGMPLDSDDIELLKAIEQCHFAEMDLGLGAAARGGLGMDEWVHFMLLRASAPSHVAAKHLNLRLRKALADDCELLGRLHAAFEAADVQGDGLLRQDHWPEAFQAVGMSHPPEEVDIDREDDGSPWALSYYEFLGHSLGLKATVVEVALYDLSKGLAQWVPSKLLDGHNFQGVWHSGIRAFGKEFWFGGIILESNFQEVPFGTPVQILRLGTTLRTYEELLEFLKEEVYVDYNPKSYDVLRRNCNHFSNELAQFLLHGKQLPEDVLLQPEILQNAALIGLLRPVLNRWLGGFGGDLTSGSAPQAVSRIDDMSEEWRSRLQSGDLVMHRKRFIDRPRAVRLRSISTLQSGERRAEIVLLRPTAVQMWERSSSVEPPWSWDIVTEQDVPMRQFYPLLDDPDGGAHMLKASLARKDSRVKLVLQRPRAVAVRPSCAKGHSLSAEEQISWWSNSLSCCICKEPLRTAQRYQVCRPCNFVLCQQCLERGLQMPGGGVFADLLCPKLGRALLMDEQWLQFRARSCFLKADHNGLGTVDRFKARRTDSRLAADLGVRPLADSELVKELHHLTANAKNAKTASFASPLELDEVTFQAFFERSLSRALDLAESGKMCQPRRRRVDAVEMNLLDEAAVSV